jgi:pimeloyl-ACP methyl ester carboxylesterase
MPRPSLLSIIRPLAAAAALAVLTPGNQVFAAQGPTFSVLRANGAYEVQNVFVRMPQANPTPDQPYQVLIALHGMGGNGADFGSQLAAEADAHGWVIVAPTVTYGDWTNPDQITREDPALIAWLSDYVNNLGQHVGAPVEPKVLVFGHSRGAQLALRFTEVHPDQVEGVAAVSAGTYTLPVSTDARTGQALEFPYGIANLAQTDGGNAFNASDFEEVPIWIGVGGSDNNTADVPAAWTPYIGGTRVDRAQNFTEALQTIGADVSLTIFPNTDHTLTDQMRAKGCEQLAEADSIASTQATS